MDDHPSDLSKWLAIGFATVAGLGSLVAWVELSDREIRSDLGRLQQKQAALESYAKEQRTAFWEVVKAQRATDQRLLNIEVKLEQLRTRMEYMSNHRTPQQP